MIPPAVKTSHSSLHKEVMVEEHLVNQLVTEQGYRRRAPADFDRALALDKELVLRFVQITQPEQWEKLVKQYSGQAESEFFKQVERNLKDFGTLHLLRRGMKIIPNIEFKFSSMQPASALVAQRVKEYEANILSAIRQVKYSQKNENAIDTVLFLNGFPVATLEIKNGLTGTSVKHAEWQYRKDRSPAGEPLLTFKRGALVHFALDEDNVSMTTRLQNGKTQFLPFNRGRSGGAGNLDVNGEFRIAYLYRDLPDGAAIFGRETWLAIIHHFLYFDGKEKVIFPRFQQLDAVRKLLADAKDHGSGRNYLIQHSAGSGKSNTIAWAAHQLINLHDANERPVFHTAIVVTDRVVLDKQLQKTVSQFEQTPGVVKRIDGTSKQLKAAIESQAKIIITTIQKFGTEHLKEVAAHPDRRYAIIIDEAHSGQSGKSAGAMVGALNADNSADDDTEDRALRVQRLLGPQPNISYLAFTATPRHVTLERFGTWGPDGKPHPFHLYSMRQAIEEGFILDVLQNYMTYQVYYELEKAIEADPRFKTSKAQKRVAHFAHLHPTALGQKVAVIVEHFRKHVMHELGGQAKGMIVTGSRESAMKYWLITRDYLEEQGYGDMKALVAFSGDLFMDGTPWTEAAANGFSEEALAGEFDQHDNYRLLIVADKYQTGFDQPKLCAMYIDRKLSGLQAVQTLSRLNRLAPGKRTFVLDFQNTMDDMQNAFAPYYEATELDEVSDKNMIFTLETRLFTFGVLDEAEIDAFAATFYKAELQPYDRIVLEEIIKRAVGRFEEIEDEAPREEFRQLLKSYLRFYTFIAQVMPLENADLEKLSSYGDWLLRLLPDRTVPAEISITDDMLQLHAFKIEEQARGSIELETGTLKGVKEFAGTPYTEEEERALSEIVQSFNERFGTQFTEADIQNMERVNSEIINDDMLDMLRNNPADVVFKTFSDAFFKGMIKVLSRDNELQNIILTDADARGKMTRLFFDRAYRAAQE